MKNNIPMYKQAPTITCINNCIIPIPINVLILIIAHPIIILGNKYLLNSIANSFNTINSFIKYTCITAAKNSARTDEIETPIAPKLKNFKKTAFKTKFSIAALITAYVYFTCCPVATNVVPNNRPIFTTINKIL